MHEVIAEIGMFLFVAVMAVATAIYPVALYLEWLYS